jgi:phage shock protein PspC (stress-responsive transcriptional regulator)
MSKRLVRSRTDRMIAGVCGGIAAYLGIDPTIIRLIFAGAFLLGFGSPVLLYLLLWLIIPLEDSEATSPSESIKANVDEIAEKARNITDEIRERIS